MDIDQARDLFKLEGACTQEELERLYNFEKNLLLQKLADDASEEELIDVQEQLETLEAAYSTLCNIATDEVLAPSEDSEPEKANNNRLLLLALIAALLLGLGWLTFQQLTSDPSQQAPSQRQANSGQDSSASKKNNNGPSSAAMTYQQRQEQKMLDAKNKADNILKQWKALADGSNISLSNTLQLSLSSAQALEQERQFGQARYAYNDFSIELSEHLVQARSYLATFQQHDKLLKQWNAMAKQQHFFYAKADEYQQRFDTVKNDLSQGHSPSFSIGELKKYNFRYTRTIEHGQHIIELRQEYYPLKKQWQNKVVGSPYYTLTPAIESLIATAEAKPADADEFEQLRGEVYPRLINHFKTQIKKN